LDVRTSTAAPTGIDLKCGTTNVAGDATSTSDSLQEFDQDVAVDGTTDLWCWVDMSNPSTGWIFDLVGRYVS